MSSEEFFVRCQICNKEFKSLTATHIKLHDMTLKEYTEKFPDSPLTCLNMREKISVGHQKLDFVPTRSPEIIEEDKNDIKVEEVKNEELKPVKEKVICSKIDFNKPSVDKQKIINHFSKFYSTISDNYLIEKRNVSEYLEYSFITDFVDLQTKTIFDFPKALFHNENKRYDHNKDHLLKKDGWTIKRYFSFKDIENEIDQVND